MEILCSHSNKINKMSYNNSWRKIVKLAYTHMVKIKLYKYNQMNRKKIKYTNIQVQYNKFKEKEKLTKMNKI